MTNKKAILAAAVDNLTANPHCTVALQAVKDAIAALAPVSPFDAPPTVVTITTQDGVSVQLKGWAADYYADIVAGRDSYHNATGIAAADAYAVASQGYGG